MKKLFAKLVLVGAFMGVAGGLAGYGVTASAQDASAPAAAAASAPEASVPAAAAPAVAAPAAPAAAAPAAASAAAAPAPVPVPNKGDTAWLLICTALVILMTLPGLGLFYGGLVRSKNMLSVLMQCFIIFSLIIVLWSIYGYSIAFTEGGAFFGGWDRLFLKGMTPDSVAATFSKGVAVPEYAYMAFQAAFAAITCALVIGAFAERARFPAVLLFVVIWFTFAYLPIAHMVWFWPGPDLYVDQAAADAATAKGGWLFQKGALDYAGGTVVHINAAIAGLVGSYMVGKRLGFGKEAFKPHSLTMTMIGASLLWFGWFGFNAGSGLEANGGAALAFVNTLLATATATMSWTFGEWIGKGKPSMLGGASGAVAGLVAVTPAAGFIGPMGSIVLGLIAGLVCLWGVNGLKRILKADDALDVFGVHGVGGILGALMTGVLASPALGGTGIYDYVTNKVSPDYSIPGQLWIQLQGVLTTLVWSGVVAFIAYKIADVIIGLRVHEDAEREGLDISSHGESAYHD
ncbi:ammonia channel protein [Pandoraea terrae]|uniref:Ammonium transporter n=1 Tax=Pandoraea terrae TaxID=1537710 RepID=A0A5E4YCR9_9BURK|nr:ammonium transporter [Pandoraea terrae]VVE46280.1 ammonia channel protein [Pandoraea terrae]